MGDATLPRQPETTGSYADHGFGPIKAQGFVFANETGWFAGAGLPTQGNVVRNNLAINVDVGFRFGEYQNGNAGMRNTVVANNTFVRVDNCGIRLHDPATNSGNVVQNNVVVPAGNGWAFCGSDRGTTIRNNLWGRGTVQGGLHAGDVRAMPDFTVGTGLKPSNYQLAAGSPGVNDGRAISAVANDKSGVSRPRGGAFDIGAFERGA